MKIDLTEVQEQGTKPRANVGYHLAKIISVSVLADKYVSEYIGVKIGFTDFASITMRLNVNSHNDMAKRIALSTLKSLITVSGLNPNVFDSNKTAKEMAGAELVVFVQQQKNDDRYVEIGRVFEKMTQQKIDELNAEMSAGSDNGLAKNPNRAQQPPRPNPFPQPQQFMPGIPDVVEGDYIPF